MGQDRTRGAAWGDQETYGAARLMVARLPTWRIERMLADYDGVYDDWARTVVLAFSDELAERAMHAHRMALAAAHVAGLR